MSIQLTDAELVAMSAAARRDDRCLEPPQNAKPAAKQKLAKKLAAAGLAREVKAKTGMAVWRRDEAAGQNYSLKLTAAGLKAIEVDVGDGQGEPSSEAPISADEVQANVAHPSSTTTPGFATPTTTATVASATEAADATIAPTPAAFREGTKISKVLELLQRDQGATLEEVIAATGWLPHTSRAALTGLRKRGYHIERRSRAEGVRGYAIVAANQV